MTGIVETAWRGNLSSQEGTMLLSYPAPYQRNQLIKASIPLPNFAAFCHVQKAIDEAYNAGREHGKQEIAAVVRRAIEP